MIGWWHPPIEPELKEYLAWALVGCVVLFYLYPRKYPS